VNTPADRLDPDPQGETTKFSGLVGHRQVDSALTENASPVSSAPPSLANSVVAARTLVAGIDLQSPLLTPGNVGLLRALSDKYESYIRQGRGREAHAMAAAMLIAWRMFSEPDIPLDLPDTVHGDLDP
jgi:hypothetical protein